MRVVAVQSRAIKVDQHTEKLFLLKCDETALLALSCTSTGKSVLWGNPHECIDLTQYKRGSKKASPTWFPALAVNGVVVAAAKLAGDPALAASPLARGTEGAPLQPPLLALHNQRTE